MQNWLRSDLDGLVRFWSTGLEISRWASKNHQTRLWPSYLPVSHFQEWVAFFHRWHWWYCAKPAQIQFSSGGMWCRSKLGCKRIIGPAGGHCFWASLDRIRHVYWVINVFMVQYFFIFLIFFCWRAASCGAVEVFCWLGNYWHGWFNDDDDISDSSKVSVEGAETEDDDDAPTISLQEMLDDLHITEDATGGEGSPMME